MRTIYVTLDSGWRFRDIPGKEASPATRLPWLPAEVPGQVHLDLMRAGVIADPLVRLYERGAQWVDEEDWIYETTFTVTEPVPDSTSLLFHGLDTVAEIELNGALLGKTDNMFIPHEFPVGDRLNVGAGAAGENTLRVTFRSALRVGRERHTAWNAGGNDTTETDWTSWGPRSFVRKAQYMYGWDWGPEPVSCGLWQKVELVKTPIARLRDWKYDVTFTDDNKATVNVEVSVERASGQENTALKFTALLSSVEYMDGNAVEDRLPPAISATVPSGEGTLGVSVSLTVENPRRWFPNGYNIGSVDGSHPPLYTLEMSIGGDSEIDAKTAKIGLRTIELLQEPDAGGKGEGFQFRVNGEDIFIKGANWIPDDSFPSRLQSDALPSLLRGFDDKVAAQIEAACDASFNMLRVWGGGLYESEHFYELCDTHGILVWQDFPYGCAYYPDTGDYAEAARVEATAAVRRLRNHPSLALWCGNNENDMLYHDNWTGHRPPRLLGEHLYHKVLPSVVEAEDPKTPYWPSSPYGGEDPNSPDFGDRHNWDVWHGVGDWTNYLKDNSRFCSEFGFASSCGLGAWDSCLAPQDKYPHSPAVRWHDKTRKGYDIYLGLIRLHYADPQTLEELVYLSQINQMEALKCGVEHYRRLKGRCWGTLIWQINDCWPVQSWSMIDSTGEPKAAYYASKKFYAPVLLSLARDGAQVAAHLTSDLRTPVTGRVTLRVETFDGQTLSEETFDAQVGVNGTAKVGTISLASAQGKEREAFVHARFEPSDGAPSVENFSYLAEPKDWQLTNPGLSVEIREQKKSGFVIRLTAQRFAPYVWLRRSDDRLLFDSTERSDNFFHLRAGEAREIIVPQTREIDSVEKLRGLLRIRTL